MSNLPGYDLSGNLVAKQYTPNDTLVKDEKYKIVECLSSSSSNPLPNIHLLIKIKALGKKIEVTPAVQNIANFVK
jgi:hypothetical protein